MVVNDPCFFLNYMQENIMPKDLYFNKKYYAGLFMFSDSY